MDILKKKAVVFTFITVLLLVVLIISFLVNLGYRDTQSKIQSSNIKVETINSFVKSLNSSYLPNALKISSNDIMIDLLNYEEQNSYVGSVNDYFKQNLPNKLQSSLNAITQLASEQGIIIETLNADYNSLQVYQDDPWHAKVKLKFNYNIKNSNNEFSWNVNQREVFTTLNISNYRDPIYLVQEGISLPIIRSAYGISGLQNINSFKSHIENAWFIDNKDSPSFIQRLEGKLALSSAYGIETLLDPFYYPNQEGNSNADYQYYTNINGLCVKDMPSNFKLDLSHISYYSREQCTV